MIGLAGTGKSRRLARIIDSTPNGTVITPVDDSLIFGPFNGLVDVSAKLRQIIAGEPNALLCFAGTLSRHYDIIGSIPAVVNVTASTVRSEHTRKRLISTVASALAVGAEAVAVHVNITSRFEGEMLETLGHVVADADSLGVPVMTIMYPRREAESGDDNYETLRGSDRSAYTDLVCHAVRVAADVGADLIKTQYVGGPEDLYRVVQACWPIPVVIAGGPLVPAKDLLQMVHDARSAGAAGVSFGRNVFNRRNSTETIKAIKAVLRQQLDPSEAVGLIEAS